MFIKSFAAIAAASTLGAGSAFAGPYVNIETNAGFSGSDYGSAVTDLHVGFEGPVGDNAGYYVQAGPALVAVDGDDTTTEMSGKAGIGADVAENLNVYGEIAFITVDGSDDNNYGVKLGAKFNFWVEGNNWISYNTEEGLRTLLFLCGDPWLKKKFKH